MLLKEVGYGFDDSHTVIKGGRTVRCDPTTKVSERKPPGVDRDTWDKHPSLRALLKKGIPTKIECKVKFIYEETTEKPEVERHEDEGVGDYDLAPEDDEADEQKIVEAEKAEVGDSTRGYVSREEVESMCTPAETVDAKQKSEADQWSGRPFYWVCYKRDTTTKKIPRVDTTIGAGKYAIDGTLICTAMCEDGEIMAFEDDIRVPEDVRDPTAKVAHQKFKTHRWKGIVILPETWRLDRNSCESNVVHGVSTAMHAVR